MSTWVKICGITRLEDARAAVQFGANAVGLILTESPRRVAPQDAFQIRQGLPGSVQSVGVFTEESIDEIMDLTKLLKLDLVQLHGAPDEGRIKAIRKICPVIQAIRVLPDGSFNHSVFQLPADHVLLDTAIKGFHGGTGKLFEWSILQNLDVSRLIVAGGVGPHNVGELVRLYRPYGVDASSQLEQSPGIKDHNRISSYVEAVRKADASLSGEIQ